MSADITINLDAHCSACGTSGATPSGLCLACITARITEKRAPAMSQLSLTTALVDLTDEEKIARGWDLAQAIRERAILDDDHAERKAAMKQEREVIEQRIAHLAEIVRTGREERPVAR